MKIACLFFATSLAFQSPNAFAHADEKPRSKACNQDYVGRYEQLGGRWHWWYQLDGDCTGSFCVQTLNNPDNPQSDYGWNCDRANVREKSYAGDILLWELVEKDGYSVIKFTHNREQIREHRVGEYNGKITINNAAKVSN